MRRVLISVEGQTEETFVREILTRHLVDFHVCPIPVIVSTKIVKQGNKFKGGLTTYQQARREIINLLKDSNAVAVTTMYDLYALPTDFPGYATRPSGDCYAKVTYLENEIEQNISNSRFKPYFQLHEFEAILFVSPEVTARTFSGMNRLRDLELIKEKHHSSEEINDGYTTAPSKRILNIFPNYEKPIYGSIIAIEVGLDKIRKECSHFNNWLLWLESLG